MTYQADVSQMQQAGFSGQEIQGWSDSQAAQMRQAGFAQHEVDNYQGMAPPAEAGGTPIHGRIPTDNDFKNAATVILNGNDHPWYEKAIDTLKNLHADTGVAPEDAVKASQQMPSFREIMESGSPSWTWGNVGTEAARGIGNATGDIMKGLAVASANTEQGQKPTDLPAYSVGNQIKGWIDKNFPAPEGFEQKHPIASGVVGGLASLPPIIATGGAGMGLSAMSSSYDENVQKGVESQKAIALAKNTGVVWGALGMADVGVLLKPVERSAPGFAPWLVAKGMQALRSGATFTGVNEFGDWISKEISSASDVPAQYKPTLQRIVTNALVGAAAGPVASTGVKGGEKVSTIPSKAPTIPSQGPNKAPEAPSSTTNNGLTPAYHFDSDSYGLKNSKGDFVQTGFPDEAAAAKSAETQTTSAAEKVQQPPSRLPPEVIDRYKKTISDHAESMGLTLTPEQLQNAARVTAEQHNPENVEKPATLENVGKEKTPYGKVPQRPPSLSEFLAKNGGLKDEGGELTAMDAANAHINPETGKPKPFQRKLVQEDGMSLDQAALKAQEGGYFPELAEGERPTINQFLDKLHNDLQGKPQHSDLDQEKLQAHTDALAHNQEIDRVSHETSIETKGKTHGQFWDEVAKHYSTAQQEKLEQSASDSWKTEALEPEELEHRPTEEIEHEWQQEQDAKHLEPVPPSAAQPKHVAGSEGHGEGSNGQVGGGVESAGRANETAEPGGGNSATTAGPDNVREPFLFQKGTELPAESAKLLQPVIDFLKRVAPRAGVEVKEDAIRTPEGDIAHGSYDRLKNLIILSLTSPDQFNTAAHEAIHAIRDVLADNEWQKLVDAGHKQGLMEKYDIEGRYTDNHDEEMVAHWFADWAQDKADAAGESKTFLQKIKDVFTGLAQKVRDIFGNSSAEDIFRKIESGEVGEREPSGEAKEGTLFQKEKEKPTLGDALRGIRDTFSPTSSGGFAKQTEQAIRAGYGEAKRERSIAETALNEFARQANEMTPKEHEDFYNYVEGRSGGAQLKNKQFQAMADAVRNIYTGFKDTLQAMPETRAMNFVTDYFTHQWAPGQEEEIKQFMESWWQQGSGRNLKKRQIPTIADGLAAGLKLEEPNPVRAVSRYAGSMSNYIASVNVLRAINTELGGSYYADGKQPANYAPLVGRNAERIENARIDPESDKIIPARTMHLYAPKEVADLYNAFYSKGFEDTKLKSSYMLARNAINANTMLELGLSAYHFSTITVQSINQDMSRILRNALAGDWQGVGDAIKGLLTPGAHFREGRALTEQYNDLKDHGVDMEAMADHFAKSNLRLGLDPLANVSTHGGFYKAWQRGELPDLMDRLKSQLTQGYGIGALKTGGEVVGRVVSDVAHPLFNIYVPTIKISAFHDLMGDWLRQHQGASDGEVAAARVRIGDMVEDRFGEMNMENLFWNKKAKELLGLSLRAPGWDLGLVRQVGGAGVDFFHLLKSAVQGGKNFDPARLDRPLFMIGAAVTYAAMNSAATYLKTGKMPSDDDIKDLIAYATGGTHKAFGEHPERAELPGHGRELIQMAPVPGKGPLSGVAEEAKNKLATLPRNVGEAVMNEDWKGKPLYDPKSKNWYQRIPGMPNAMHVMEGFKPFSMEQLFEPPEGTHLTLAERFMGVRPAGAKIVNPEGLKKFNEEKKR